jgi:tetratricopeptide (TPR) repeat protein
VVLRELGRFDESAVAFRKSLAFNPNNPFPLNALAWYLLTAPDHRQRSPLEALELSRRAVKVGPDVATYFNTLGLAEYRNGLWSEAIAMVKKSIEMTKGTDPTDFFIMAMAHHALGDQTEAEQSYRRGAEGVVNAPASEWECGMIWAEAAHLLGKPGPVLALVECKAEPDRAMEALRRMAASGFLRPQVLRTSPDLAPLRGRRDFQLLAMDLAMPAKPFAPYR